MAGLVLIIIALIFVFLWYRDNFGYWQKHNIPNVPGFLSGRLLDVFRKKINFGAHLHSVYSDARFQNAAVVGIYSPHRPALLIRDPDLIKSILTRDYHRFHDRFARSDPHSDPIGSMVLTIAPYNFWKKMRSQVASAFSGGKLKQMYPLMQVVGENLEQYLLEKGTGLVLEIKQLASQYTIDSFCTTIFGIESKVLENSQDHLLSQFQRMTHFNWKREFHWFLIFLMPNLTRIFGAKLFYAETEDFIRKSITFLLRDRERSGLKRNDLIDIFLKLKLEAIANEDDLPSFMNGIISQAGTFMLAGYDTTSNTLTKVLLELAKHPDIQARLREELLSAFPEGKGKLSLDALSELQYLGMVMDETLRMYPSGPVLERQHNAFEDGTCFSLEPYFEYTLPPALAIYISAIGLHYYPMYWPNPTVFDPERFTKENKKARHPMVYMPFGHGPRNCVAGRFGLLQVKLGLAYILKGHSVQLCDQTIPYPDYDANILAPKIKGGVHLRIVKENFE